MPRAPLWLSIPAAFLLLTACTGESLVPDPLPREEISPEADLTAPGMIPPECESLLQQSQNWGYRPGEQWRPGSDARAGEVAKFFGSFYLVPENTSRFYRVWLNEPAPAGENEAREKAELLGRAQSCDAALALTFLEGVLNHRWESRLARKEAGEGILRFVLNQQTRMAPLVARAVSVAVAERAMLRGMIAGSSRNLKSVQRKIERARSELQQASAQPNSLSLVQSIRKELQVSEEVREELSRYLPLP